MRLTNLYEWTNEDLPYLRQAMKLYKTLETDRSIEHVKLIAKEISAILNNIIGRVSNKEQWYVVDDYVSYCSTKIDRETDPEAVFLEIKKGLGAIELQDLEQWK